jgi:hypothetical protein
MLKFERDAQYRSAKRQVLKQLIGAFVKTQMAIDEEDVAPFELVSDAGHSLPGELGSAGANCSCNEIVIRTRSVFMQIQVL